MLEVASRIRAQTTWAGWVGKKEIKARRQAVSSGRLGSMSLARSRRPVESSSSVTSDELGAPEHPGCGEGWQLPKPTNGERNVFGHIKIGDGLWRKRLFAPSKTQRGSNYPAVRRSQAPLTSQPCLSGSASGMRSFPSASLVADDGPLSTTLSDTRRPWTETSSDGCFFSFFFLFSKENYIEMRFYL